MLQNGNIQYKKKRKEKIDNTKRKDNQTEAKEKKIIDIIGKLKTKDNKDQQSNKVHRKQLRRNVITKKRNLVKQLPKQWMVQDQQHQNEVV